MNYIIALLFIQMTLAAGQSPTKAAVEPQGKKKFETVAVVNVTPEGAVAAAGANTPTTGAADPKPTKGAADPKPTKGAAAPKPTKGAAGQNPTKGAAAPKPTKGAADPKPTKG